MANFDLINNFILENGESTYNDKIERCTLAIDVTKFLQNDDENWLRLKEEGIWDGFRQCDELIKFIYIDDKGNVMLLGMDDDSFDDSYDIDDEVFSFAPYTLDELSDESVEFICKEFELEEIGELHEYYGEYGYDEAELSAHGLEIVVWAKSQLLFDLPKYREHCQLINDEEGLEKFGSSAYVVEIQWLNEMRENGKYPY